MGSGATLQPGTLFAGEFRILKPLAEGGMGAVYLAEQLTTGRIRALKLMHPSLVTEEKSRARFLQEARLGARIKSAHIVEVTGSGIDEDSGIPWLSMELLEGEELAQRMTRTPRWTPAEVLALFEQLTDALEAAHQAGVLHRDLKPENLFLAKAPMKQAPYLLKVLDFGIAKLLAEHRNAATMTTAMGSPLWMAPEQTKVGAKITAATDLWPLGLLAFRLLTGKHYWLAANVRDEQFNLQALLVEVLLEELVPPSERARALFVGSYLPNGFDAWFARCVHRSPDERFSSVTELFRALQQVLSEPSPALTPLLHTQSPPPLPVTDGPEPSFWHHVRLLLQEHPRIALLAILPVWFMVSTALSARSVESKPTGSIEEPSIEEAPQILLPTTTPSTAPAGHLAIFATPTCSISIDGRSAGRTPGVQRVTIGTHHVQCRANGRLLEQTATVTADRITRVEFYPSRPLSYR